MHGKQNIKKKKIYVIIIIRFTVVGIENKKVENSVFMRLMNMYVLKTTCNSTHRQN